MIYSYQRTINLEDREVTKKIFICCDDTSSSVLVSRNVFASLKFFKDLQASHMLKVAVLPEMSVPVITVDPAEKTFDVTGIVNIFYDTRMKKSILMLWTNGFSLICGNSMVQQMVM